MTTIVTDGKSMACDGLCTSGRYIVTTRAKKINIASNGALIGHTGVRQYAPIFLEYYNSVLSTLSKKGLLTVRVPKEKLFTENEEAASTSFIILESTNKCYTYSSEWEYLEKVDEFPFSIGSGSALAIGALKGNPSLTLKECLKVVSRLDIHTGGTIRQYDIKS